MISTNHTITSKLYGGIGNQLFQIAIAFANALKYETQFKIENPKDFVCGQGNHPSVYKDSIYKKIEFIDILESHHIIKEVGGGIFQPVNIDDVLKYDIPQTILFDGYFQSERYFYQYSPQIKELFTPEEGIIQFLEKNSNIFVKFPELREDNDYCFIGIRRGDYLKAASIHNPCGMTYFNNAINMMNKKVYYITSDDYEWARKNFVGDNFKFLDIGNDIIQLYAACLFKNYIISNSSFHWWGSFLSIYDSPRIIAPDKWITHGTGVCSFGSIIYRDCMEVIERPVETV